MIGYPVSSAQLLTLISTFNGRRRNTAKKAAAKKAAAKKAAVALTKGLIWLNNAAVATAACKTAKGYVESDNANWSAIKDVFIEHQNEKCAYCERLMPGKSGRGEYDVEHYRPKSQVKDWFATPSAQDALPDWPSNFVTGGSSATGYYLLPFAQENYAVACRTCNSNLKSDYFPIGGAGRALTGTSPAAMHALEMPWLLFPLADWDHPPESYIRFQGILAEPVQNQQVDAIAYWRARVTIAFFRLNRNLPLSDAADPGDDEGRENLYRERALTLDHLAVTLDSLEQLGNANNQDRQRKEKMIKLLCSPASAHSNCCLSFVALWLSNRAEAMQIWRAVSDYLTTATPGT